MARVLFTSTQGVGHFRPLRPFMASAIRMGHDVAVVVPPALAEMAHKDGVRVHVGSDPPGDELDAVWRQVHRASHAAAEQLVLGEIFGRLKTAALLPTAREVVTTWRPDIVIHETAEFSGVLAAEQAHVPHATIGISHARTDMVDAVAPILAQWMPGVAARILAAPLDPGRRPALTKAPGLLSACDRHRRPA